MKCLYCGSRAEDDNYGNCSACGAPRQEAKQLEFQPSIIEYSLTSSIQFEAGVREKVEKVMQQDFDRFIKALKS